MENLLTDEQVIEMIVELEKLGFPERHLPGGTSKDGSFFVGGVIPFYDHVSKKTFFLILPYNPYFHLDGESGHNKKNNESPEEALAREIMEETGYHTKPENFELIFRYSVPDNRPGKEGQFHSKYFFLVNDFSGTKFDFKGPNPIDGETSAPFWVSASLATSILYYSHTSPLKKAIQMLQLKSIDYAYSLMNIR